MVATGCQGSCRTAALVRGKFVGCVMEASTVCGEQLLTQRHIHVALEREHSMNRKDFEIYQSMGVVGQTVALDEVGNVDRTLAYGYTCVRESWHAYVYHGEIHVVVYTGGWDTRPADVKSHVRGRKLDAILLRPDKRVYPHHTDAVFATLMLAKGCPLPFTTFDDEMDPRTPFAGHIVR